MTATLVFLDTETTSLRPDRRVWDIALVRREPDGAELAWQWFVDAADLDLANADPFALKIGHFYQRHPAYAYPEPRTATIPEADVLANVEHLTRDAHIVGCVPNFDTEVLATRMRAHGILPAWHYHLIDVEALAVGYITNGLRRARAEAAERGRELTVDHDVLPRLPWKSDDLGLMLGVAPLSEEDRHTALGDARWARDMYDAVMGKADGNG